MGVRYVRFLETKRFFVWSPKNVRTKQTWSKVRTFFRDRTFFCLVSKKRTYKTNLWLVNWQCFKFIIQIQNPNWQFFLILLNPRICLIESKDLSYWIRGSVFAKYHFKYTVRAVEMMNDANGQTNDETKYQKVWTLLCNLSYIWSDSYIFIFKILWRFLLQSLLPNLVLI